ncbi:heparan-alpha-glucosaminide N-acetyltransferase-like [Abrus precatorius]|uniref:Heparan-alpha-glucosaminide N-acetyltransferase-like n=1 Tax=Abrus precatorius TaxID=3816 RepID=A0A8B8L3B0_ABRPR|nr:heparan-alpha-glucosaminide N-acetyltransferase-like [Abrus precatorius]
MDEESKRMEEGLNPALKGEGKGEMIKSNNNNNNGGCIIGDEKDTMAKGVDEIAEQEQPAVKQKRKRVATLDAFRGLTIVLMILVDDGGEAYPRIDHSPWNGCTLADFVMPFFLFIVGVAIALALKRVPKKKDAVKKIILRTLKLLFWGILLQGGYSHAPDDLDYGVDMKHIRWCGILQRIALVYCVVALIETFTTKLRPTTLGPGHLSIFTAYKWFGGFVAFLIYMITTFTLYVPDWSFVDHLEGDELKRYTVICGMRGHLGPACNAVGHVDRQVWGVNHLYSQPVWRRLKACTFSSPGEGPFREDAPSWCRAPFEPEGLLSSISAIISGTVGIHYGHVLIHFKDHSERLKQWVSMGFVLLILAIILHFTDAIPLNKQLYSFSYVCFTAGAAGIVFSAFYILIDVWGLRTPFLFLEWIGMNAMLVFVMAAEGIFAAFVNGWYYENPHNSLVHWIKKHIFVNVWHSERVGTLLYVIFAEITFWGVVAGVLHKLGIYWKL